jgi:glycogen operon protein
MLSHGDELGRTQQGNNNAYCQDSPLAWVDWMPGPERVEWLAFVRKVFALRQRAPLLRRAAFLPSDDRPDAPWRWFTPGGEPLTHADWTDPGRHAVVALLRPDVDGASPWMAPVAGERWWLLALNGGARAHVVLPPELPGVTTWRRLLDTAEPRLEGLSVNDKGARLAPHALVLLEAVVAG